MTITTTYGSMASTDSTHKPWSSGSHSETGQNEEDDQVTFESLGVPRPQSQSVSTTFGKRRLLSSLTRGEWGFAVLSVLSILGAAGLTIERIVTTAGNGDQNSADVTYAIVLLLTILFCLFYVINGIFGERPFELLIFILGTLILMIYCIVNYVHSVGSTTLTRREYTIKLARLILIVAVGPINIVFGAYYANEYHKSKNFIFRTVGANIALQDLCSKFFFTESLFKIDLQLELTLVILVLKEGFAVVTNLEIIVLVVGVVYALAWCIAGFCSISRENKILVYVVLGSSWCEPAYIIYKLVDVVMDWDNLQLFIPAGIIIAGILGLVARVAVCGFLIYVYRNFGRGMTEKAYGVFQNPPESKSESTT